MFLKNRSALKFWLTYYVIAGTMVALYYLWR